MTSAPTTSTARSQAWISTVRFTMSHNISAAELRCSTAKLRQRPAGTVDVTANY
jgi:hypothetical protein